MIHKFRAFIKANTETVYGGLGYSDDCVLPVGLIDFTDGEVTVWGCGREDCGLCGDDFRLDDIVLMQSTGLKDKNGKYIFEGDIVKIENHPFHNHIQIDGNYEVGINERKQLCAGSWLLYEVLSYATVIGNFHEKPELLEVPDEII